MKIIAILVSLVLFGCAKTHLIAPQGGAVAGGFSRVNSGVTTAQAQRGEIARTNVEARSNLERADSKDALIKAWKVWKKEHP